MGKDHVQQILNKLGSLPPLPAAVERLCRLTRDPDVSVRDLARAVSADQILTARILRVANSAFYGLSGRVRTVSRAIMILGFRSVRSVALGVSMFNVRGGKEGASPPGREGVFRHSVAVACGARLLASRLPSLDPEEVFVAGLLHDIGKLVFIEHFFDLYVGVLKRVEDGRGPLHVVEKELVGMDHADAGRELCRHWKVPEPLALVVAGHHLPFDGDGAGSDDDGMVRVIRMADNLAKVSEIGGGLNPYVEIGELRCPGGAGVRPEELEGTLLGLPGEVERAAVYFDSAGPAVEARTDPASVPPAVAVLLDDPDERALVTLTLLAGGYRALASPEMPGDEVPLAGAVVDGTAPGPWRDLCARRSAPVLEFARWREETGWSRPDPVPIERLRAWLIEGMRDQREGSS